MNVSIESPAFDKAARAEIEAIVAAAIWRLALAGVVTADGVAALAMNIADEAAARANLARLHLGGDHGAMEPAR